MIQYWFLSPFGMMEAIFCGWRYEISVEGVEGRTNLFNYMVRIKK